MKLQIEKNYAEDFIVRFPEWSGLNEQLKFSNKVELPVDKLAFEHLVFLYEAYSRAGKSGQRKVAQIGTLRQALNAGGKVYEEGELEGLVPDMAEYLIKNGIRGWLFKANKEGRMSPYLVSRIDFTPPGEEESGRILVELKANSMAKINSVSLMIRERDIIGKSLPQLLIEKGFLKETAELIEAYDQAEKQFFAWRADYGRQFLGSGTGIYAEDPTANHRRSDWTRKNVVILSSSGGEARLVNDEEIIKERQLSLDSPGEILSKYLRKAGRSSSFDDKVENQAEALQEQMPKKMFTMLPVHPYILMFHLELHHHLWVHVDNLQAYEYQPALKEKLILPQEQTDLIDILTAEMDLLMDDIVAGKSGGTTVLCAGPPGVGKTLTAEVYSEIIKRPLYRVHSGQLGLNVTEMEVALKETLTRAQRWGAVMLIDEADVYIKRRDDNIAANAVVGVFLRVLEYFNGLLFLTTNRVTDIDEAIVSRCIALIKYQSPNYEERCKIWTVMAEQFDLQLETPIIPELAELFADASGRDIKGLTKLVAKYCHHKDLSPSMEVFKRCSVFRGMDS